jgi:hypothetical protein
MSMAEEKFRRSMEEAKDCFDAALIGLNKELHLFAIERSARVPDYDDWDDTLMECAGGLTEARRYVTMVREKYMECAPATETELLQQKVDKLTEELDLLRDRMDRPDLPDWQR